MTMFTRGEVALVTAAAGAGIGRAIATHLGTEGAELVISDAHERRAKETAEKLSADLGREVLGLRVDVTEENEVRAQVDRALERFGRVDILCNNAGFLQEAQVWEMSLDVWHRVLDVNLTGSFLTTRAVLPHMIERRSGVIVNIASINAFRGIERQSHYAAAKAGVAALTRATAEEVGRFGVRVAAVSPGWVYNPFLERAAGDDPEAFQRVVQGVADQTPLGRLGEPDDIARVVAFLASAQAGFITGEVVGVTGGLYMRP
jgi:3-oxoacyl-[acyl-carrier protein] reductase